MQAVTGGTAANACGPLQLWQLEPNALCLLLQEKPADMDLRCHIWPGQIWQSCTCQLTG